MAPSLENKIKWSQTKLICCHPRLTIKLKLREVKLCIWGLPHGMELEEFIQLLLNTKKVHSEERHGIDSGMEIVNLFLYHSAM